MDEFVFVLAKRTMKGKKNQYDYSIILWSLRLFMLISENAGRTYEGFDPY